MLKTFKILPFLLFLFSASSYGQNLVPNPSFEDTVNCPTADNQVYHALGWDNYSDQSPDYFNSCTSNNDIDVPNNWGGYQVASSGNAYCAISSFFPSTPNKREIIGRNLSSSMVIGTMYYFSMKVNLSINTFISSSYASNKLGVRFSTVPYSSTQPSPINNTAHIWTDSIITDTLNWTTVFGSFVADSAYNYIAIGNFFDDANTDTTKIVNGTPSFIFAYYYIDDICVSTDSSFCYNLNTDIPETNLENQFLIYPNPVANYISISQNIKSHTATVFLFDLQGKLILNQSLNHSEINKINITSIPNGMYLILIITDESTYQQKLIINH